MKALWLVSWGLASLYASGWTIIMALEGRGDAVLWAFLAISFAIFASLAKE